MKSLAKSLRSSDQDEAQSSDGPSSSGKLSDAGKRPTTGNDLATEPKRPRTDDGQQLSNLEEDDIEIIDEENENPPTDSNREEELG